jgi:adhesin/invasin
VLDRAVRLRASWVLPTLVALGMGACGDGDDLCTGPFCFSPPTRPVPSSIEAGPHNGQQGAPGRELPQPIDVVVKDSDGQPVSGVTVTFRVSSGGGTLSSATAESDVNGLAAVDWRLGEELGTQRLEAIATNAGGAPLNGSPVQLSATAARPPPATIVLLTGPPETALNGAPFEQQPVLEVRDAWDQPLPGIEVVASVASGGGSLTGSTSATTDASGHATFTNLALVGPQAAHTIRFSVAAPPLEEVSGPIQLLAGNPETLTGVEPLTFEGTVNSPVSPGPSVAVRDAAGNGVPGVAVTFSPNRNASVAPETATTNDQGIAQVSWTLGTTANVQYTLTARIESSPIAPVQFNAVARAGAAGRLRVEVQPSSPTQSGTAFAQQPVVQVVDQQGNPAPQPGITVTATISSGPTGSLQNQTATTNAAGQAGFSGLTLTGEVGSYTLSFSAPGLAGVTSAPFNITTGSAARLALVTAPSPMARSRAPIVIQPVVQLQDASGNPIRQAGTQVTATVSGEGTTLTGATATTDENGRAAFSGLTITGKPGPRDLTFSAAGMQSVSVRVTLPSVATVSTAPSHPVSAVVGTTVAGPVVTWTLRDAATRPVADADFILIVPSGGTAATLTPFSDANGAVQVGAWTLGTTAGYQYLILRLPDGREFRDSILATPDAPADVIIHSGDGQSAPAGQDLPLPLVARVVDRHGNGVADMPVQWATCDGAAGPTINTDAGGYSSVTQPTTQPTESGCTRASVTNPPAFPSFADFVEFHYTVTGAASQEESPTGVSAAQSGHSGGPPPVRLRRSR